MGSCVLLVASLPDGEDLTWSTKGATLRSGKVTQKAGNEGYYRGEKGEEKAGNADGWSKKMAGLFSCAQQKVHGRDI